MKKTTSLVVSLLMVCAAFAQKIPEGRNLVAAVHDFAKPENWGGVNSVSYDIQNDTYVLKAYTMGKVLLSFQRQDQTVTIKGNGDSFTVEVTDVTSANCDKNGKPTSKPLANQASTAKKIADMYVTEISNRIEKWTDEEYQNKFDEAITNPNVLFQFANSTSDLYFKKYIEKNNIVGKKVSADFKLYSIDESKKDGFDYKATSIILDSTLDSTQFAGNTLMIHIYSNNDKLLSLKKDDIYKVNGRVSKIEKNELLLNQITYEIEE